MRYLVALLLVFNGLTGFAQNTINQGTPNTIVKNKGAYQVDSLMVLPYRDTVAWNGLWGNVTIRPQDNFLYFRRNGTWGRVSVSGGASGDAITWADTLTTIGTKSDLLGYVKYSDTVALLQYYVTANDTVWLHNTLVDHIAADLDLNPTNELQTLSWLQGTRELSISDGNTVVIPDSVGLTTEVDPVFTAHAAFTVTYPLIGNWNTAYSEKVNSIEVTPGSTKTIILNQQNGDTLNASFVDENDIYSSGVGININGANEISNTGDLSNTNEIQHLVRDGSNIKITSSASSVIDSSKTYVEGTGVSITGNYPEYTISTIPVDLSDYVQYTDTLSGAVTTQYRLDTVKANLSGQDINSLTFTGTATKTLTLTRNNSAWIQGTFTDLDNQTLALSSDDTLSISGGNSVHLPYIRSMPEGQHQSFTGTQTTTLVLSTPPAASSQVLISMNNAWLDPVDWTRTGTLITLSFTTSTTDLITVYYSN